MLIEKARLVDLTGIKSIGIAILKPHSIHFSRITYQSQERWREKKREREEEERA